MNRRPIVKRPPNPEIGPEDSRKAARSIRLAPERPHVYPIAMAKCPVAIDYNTEMDALTRLLGKVSRPGDYFAAGSLLAPMPTVEIKNVGLVAFPLPNSQAREIVGQAAQAPYGRGEQTIVDTSVRNVWQVGADQVQISGKTWRDTFGTVLSRVAQGLGCPEKQVSAELYKLLLYEKGGFFVSHRDTEKAPGMFGTLVIVLPSAHRGGELVVRHGGREVSLDLRAPDYSELSYAAFYADCEHEIRPVTEGNRLCLVYNLVQIPSGTQAAAPFAVPDYRNETRAAAGLLAEWVQTPDSPPKIVYLLEHLYTPAGLSFSALKNGDAVRAKILADAAEQAGCAVHLGIVHIEESGSAEAPYEPRHSRSSRWGRYGDDTQASGPKTRVVQEIIAIGDVDSRQYVDTWVDPADRHPQFGNIPLQENELLPAGALDNQAPDEQSLSEATGNEGATFDRSYRRAAVILWSRDRHAEVLMQSGIAAGLPCLEELVDASAADVSNAAAREKALALANLLVERWNDPRPWRYWLSPPEPDRAAMLGLLLKLGDISLLETFIAEVVARHYDGDENAQLTAASRLLGPKKAAKAICGLIDMTMPALPAACLALVVRWTKDHPRGSSPEIAAASRQIAKAALKNLPKIITDEREMAGLGWDRRQKAKPLDGEIVSNLLLALEDIGLPELSREAAAAIIAHPKAFASDTILEPSLSVLAKTRGDEVVSNPAFSLLWNHTVNSLLDRSEYPPEEPKDWVRAIELACACERCRELKAFAADPVAAVHRFRVRADLRYHIQSQTGGFDFQCETEEKGSPHTLICSKNQKSFERERERYIQDLHCLLRLAKIAQNLGPAFGAMRLRAEAAISRRK